MLLNILILAAIIERVWENLQLLIGEKRLTYETKLIGSAVLALFAAIAFELDILYALDAVAAPSLPGYIMTGFILALGSNVIHDLIDIVQGISSRFDPGLQKINPKH